MWGWGVVVRPPLVARLSPSSNHQSHKCHQHILAIANLNTNTTLGTSVSKTVVGTSINLTATTVNTLFGTQTELNTTLQLVGRDSGARVNIPITITKVTT